MIKVASKIPGGISIKEINGNKWGCFLTRYMQQLFGIPLHTI